MGPANDYWPADLGGTRRTCPLVHKPSVCGADSRDRGASSNISFPLPDLSWDARRIDIGISIGVLLFTYRRETAELNFIVGNE